MASNPHASRAAASYPDLQTSGAQLVDLASRCRLCGCRLGEAGSASHLGVCNECSKRPEARRLGSRAPASARSARSFTAAERALIRKVHGYIPTQQLLALLNERLMCNLGPDAAPYTMEQLHAEMQDSPPPGDAGDWSSLRRVIAHARRSGLLATITAQTIEDFAVVFSVSSAQLLRLKDIVLAAREDAAGERP